MKERYRREKWSRRRGERGTRDGSGADAGSFGLGGGYWEGIPGGSNEESFLHRA